MLLAIDPGTVESAYVLMDGYKPIRFGKVPNDDLLSKIYDTNADSLAVEMVESYGMSVGKEVFETVFWIGRFWEVAEHIETRSRIYRREEKITLCGTSKAKDANIRQALIDRFAYGVPNGGKGIKAAGAEMKREPKLFIHPSSTKGPCAKEEIKIDENAY